MDESSLKYCDVFIKRLLIEVWSPKEHKLCFKDTHIPDLKSPSGFCTSRLLLRRLRYSISVNIIHILGICLRNQL